MSAIGPDGEAGYQYHLLRGALDRFSKSLAELDDRQLEEARRQADKTYDLESMVLASGEAGDVVIPPEQVDAAFAEVLARYPDRSAFAGDLHANGLSEARLRQALHRELLFDGVLQRVGARRLTVSQIDARLYYELHTEKFFVPEQRSARHILITINDDFEENNRLMARARIDRIAEKLGRSPHRFADQARKHSECPTAMEGGRLGNVLRGQLFPQLDSALFSMREGAISDVLETEVGFHLLWCEKTIPARAIPFSKAEPRIRTILDERNRRNCQKAFLKQLREACKETEN